MKLVWKLTIFNTFIVSITIITLFWTFYGSLKAALIKAQQVHLKNIVKLVETKGARWSPATRRFFVKVNENVLNDPYGIAAKLPDSGGIFKIGDEYYMVVMVTRPQRKVIIAANVTPLINGFQSMATTALITSIIGIGFSFGIALLLSSYSLRPLKSLLNDLKKISGESLSLRLGVPKSGDEIATLIKEINSMLDRIEQAYRAQERFVHDVSHELRNPLASMKGFIDVLKKWGIKEKEIFEEATSELASLVEEMSQLVDNLLILAKPIELELKKTSVAKLVREILKNLRIPPRIMVKLEGDAVVSTSPQHLKIILKNIIENAVKFANSLVQVKIEENHIIVEDDGPGIPKEEQDRIFERFYRVDASRDRRTKGHGIGLSIVKELSEKLKIKITLESQPGKGSRFILSWGEKA